MGALIFVVSVTGVACWISYYYLHIHPDGAYAKKKEPEPEVEKDDGKDFWD